jgi:5-methylcytosine-specific restriction endonuclease McrA
MSNITLALRWRVLASLIRSGVIRIESNHPYVRLVLVRERLPKRKPLKLSERAKISRPESQRLLREDGYRCCRCEQTLSEKQMEVDHIVPLCLLGADSPGNWAALCRRCNREKWECFERRRLKWYRGEQVHGSVGLRYVSGAHWPFINGRTRKETRQLWVATDGPQ